MTTEVKLEAINYILSWPVILPHEVMLCITFMTHTQISTYAIKLISQVAISSVCALLYMLINRKCHYM